MFLYELIWNFIGAAVILIVERKADLRWGRTIGLYLIWYGTGRTWLEDLRLDPTEFLLAGVKINMVTAMAAALLGVVFIIVQTRRKLGAETSVYLPGRGPDAAAPSAGARTPDVHSDVDDDLVSASPSADGRSDVRQPPGA